MIGCRDPRYSEWLHAYEIGILSAEDRAAFEQHLLECDYCFARVEKLEHTAQLIRRDPEVRTEIHAAVSENEAADESAMPDAPAVPARAWPRIVPPLLAAAAVILILLVTNWRIVIQPTPEAVATANRVAIMNFDDLTEDAPTTRLGEVAANLLTTDLAESFYLQVISPQRIADALRLNNLIDETTSAPSPYARVALEVQARWLIIGSILQTKPHVVITTQLVEFPGGAVTAAHRLDGAPGEDIFAMIDKVSAQIKRDLSLPSAATEEPDPRVEQMTTHSTQAYAYYLAGIDNFNKLFWSEAANDFYTALKYDSSFAMAYYYLSRLVDRSLITQAITFIDHAGRRDQYFIRSRQAAVSGDIPTAIGLIREATRHFPDEKDAYYLLGQYLFEQYNLEEAICNFRRAVEVDPLFARAYSSLAYAYDERGELEQAILALNEYISLAPDEPNPYETSADIYANNGRLDDAITSYRRALTIKPDFVSSLLKLGNMYLFKWEFAAAESCYAALMNDYPSTRSTGELYRAYIPVTQGKWAEALRMLEEGIQADSLASLATGNYGQWSVKSWVKARVYVEQGKWDLALSEAARSAEISDLAHPGLAPLGREFNAQLFAEAGQIERATQLAEELRRDLEQAGTDLWGYWYARGAIDLARGELDSSIMYFERAANATTNFPAHYMLARVYQQAGRLADAVDEYETELTTHTLWRLCWGFWSSKIHYYLGVAYEDSRWYDKAGEQYTLFLEVYKDADPAIAEVADARERLARLRQTP